MPAKITARHMEAGSEGRIPALAGLPAIPVRLNRALVLRQRSTTRNTDMHHKSEMSQYVTGQNKAVKQDCCKRVGTWYREQTFFLEKMNRYQTHAIEKLARLEKEKTQLISYVDKLTAAGGNSSGKHSTKKTLANNSQAVKSVGFVDSTQDSSTRLSKVYHLPPLLETEEPETRVNGEGDVPERTGSRLKTAISLPNLAKRTSNELIPQVDTSKVKEIPLSRSSENIAAQINNKADDILFHLTESPVPGARRAPIPVPSSASSSIDPKEVYRRAVRTRPSTDNARQPDFSFLKLHRSRSIVDEMRSRSVERSPWTFYRREADGSIIPAESPYKRKDFPKPKEKDYSLFRKMIRTEEKHRRKTKVKFERLREDLDTLEKWNPLDDVRDKHHPADDDEEPGASDKVPRVHGTLGAMIAAFGGREEWLLSQLDPDSPEALKLCRYLRIKNDDDEGLDDTEARLERRESWKANVPEAKSSQALHVSSQENNAANLRVNTDGGDAL